MSKGREERIDDALSRLVDRLTPSLEDGDDDAAADDRYARALQLARDVIDRHGSPTTTPDVHHVSELIKRKCT